MKILGLFSVVSTITLLSVNPCFAGATSRCVVNCLLGTTCTQPLANCANGLACTQATLADCKTCATNCCALKKDAADETQCTTAANTIENAIMNYKPSTQLGQ